jgi:spermidine synthase
MMKRSLIAAAALWLGLAPAADARTDIHSERSLYRNIVVYEDDGLRCMIFNKRARTNARQTCMKLAAPDELVFNFTKMMMASLYLDPDPKDILIVGLGGGTLAQTLLKILPEAHIDAVEVDRAVINVADKFFGVRAGDRLAIHEADGRIFVKRQIGKKRYDLVMLDAFNEDYIPEHMLTREFLAELKQVMKPNAVLAANTFTSSALYDHESATYAAVFGEFYNLKTNNRIILTRLDGPPPMSEIEKNARTFEAAFKPLGVGKDWLLPMFSTEIDWKRDARILTDQYSPSNLLNSRGR